MSEINLSFFFYFIVQEKVSKPNGKDGQVPGFKQQQQKNI